MMQFKQIILRSWKHHFWTNTATTAVITLSFMIVCGLWLSSANLSRIMDRWGENIQLTVYLKDGTTKDQVDGVDRALRSYSTVDSVQFVGKESAAETFKQSLASYGPHFLKALTEDGESPFPASFFVVFKKEARNPATIEEVAKGIVASAGVEDVSYGEEWISNYNGLIRFVHLLTFIVGGALLLGSLFTVSNSIRASVSARRREIEILELVGATESMIRAPFVVEGAFQGALAASSAIAALGIGYWMVLTIAENNITLASGISAIQFFPWFVVVAIVTAGTVIGALGSYLCVARLNTGWAASEDVA